MEKICKGCHSANPAMAVNCGRCGSSLEELEPKLKLARSAEGAQTARNDELKTQAKTNEKEIHHVRNHRKFRQLVTAVMVILLLGLAVLIMPFGWDVELLPLPDANSKPLADKIEQALNSTDDQSVTGTPADFPLYLTGLINPFKNIKNSVGQGSITPRLVVSTDYPSQTIRLIHRDSLVVPIRKELTFPVSGITTWQGAHNAKFGAWPWSNSVLDGTRSELQRHAQVEKLQKRLNKIEVLPDGRIRLFLNNSNPISQ